VSPVVRKLFNDFAQRSMPVVMGPGVRRDDEREGCEIAINFRKPKA
jgi:hypothetical protein